MKVLVTGANGHIGSNTVRALLEAGHQPVAFVRPDSDRRALSRLDVELREGDLLDEGSVAAAVGGTEVVLHVGAVHRNYSPEPSRITEPAVVGTRHVMAAAAEAGVRRVVHTSTGATVGFARDPARPLDETHSLSTAKSAYIRGKIEAERVALSAASDGLEVVVLNPSGVFGPWDYKPTPATRALIGLLQGDPAFLHVCVTDVGDVADAHVRAMERGESGERYLVTGDNVSPRQLAEYFQELGGVRPSTFRPPKFLMKLLVGRMEKKAAREGGDSPASRDAIDDLAGGNLVYDASKSRVALGMSYRPARDVLRDAFRWLLHAGLLAPKTQARMREALGPKAAPDPEWV